MFDFIRKPFLWDAWDKGLHREIAVPGRFHLKSIQDLAVYAQLRGSKGLAIAEIGGGASRLLEKLAADNRCCNVEKFEGADGGPDNEIKIPGVTNVRVFLGEHSALLESSSLDVVFSVSVVEHVPDLEPFLEDGLRILRQGGLWLHAIDCYVEDNPTDYWHTRFEDYRNWLKHPALEPVGPVFDGPLKFTCDIATNPDDVMHSWGKISPTLIDLRKRAQSVSLLVAARKK